MQNEAEPTAVDCNADRTLALSGNSAGSESIMAAALGMPLFELHASNAKGINELREVAK
jgi:hypothetical protein